MVALCMDQGGASTSSIPDRHVTIYGKPWHMKEDNVKDAVMEAFFGKINTAPFSRCIDPCFITGKACVYTEAIEYERNNRKDKRTGFVITPFRPNIRSFTDRALAPYLQSCGKNIVGKLTVSPADTVRRTGYVICEKICKEIQQSDFVIADTSIPNHNVFYELGLAYGIGHKIIIVHHAESDFGDWISKKLSAVPLVYSSLDPKELSSWNFADHVWQKEKQATSDSTRLPLATLFLDEPSEGTTFDAFLEETKREAERESESNQENDDVSFDLKIYVAAAVSTAIDGILRPGSQNDYTETEARLQDTHLEVIEQLRDVDTSLDLDGEFSAIRKSLDEAYCPIIRTDSGKSGCLGYFWLGYCHAMGKNAVPLSVLESLDNDKNRELAFDIRPLWHMRFVKNEPMRLFKEMEEALRFMILSDFSDWSRKRFWNGILGRRGKVSIFTGATYNPETGHDMIAEWDLRAASELTTFFASNRYAARIESPVYQPSRHPGGSRTAGGGSVSTNFKEYTGMLEDMLDEKNCVIIGSADVNPLTEVALAGIYGVENEHLFHMQEPPCTVPWAVVGFKEESQQECGKNLREQQRFFCVIEPVNDKEKKGRGFRSSMLQNKDQMVRTEFVTAYQDKPTRYDCYAHLIIARNPFSEGKENRVPDDQDGFVIVLNGITGPATFALAQVLTGGMHQEGVSSGFVSYDEDFDSVDYSEKIFERITNDFEDVRLNRKAAVQYILKVEIGPADDLTRHSEIPNESRQEWPIKLLDWRHVRRWKLSEKMPSDFSRPPAK